MRAHGDFIVRLAYQTHANLDYFQRGVLIRYVRLIANVGFETLDGWTDIREAIIDTGVPISVIPRRVWQQARHGFFSDATTEISIGGRTVQGKLGQVTLRVHDAEDGEQISPPLAIKANLLSDDSYPIILGFEDFLTEVTLYSNFPRQEAYLSLPFLSPE